MTMISAHTLKNRIGQDDNLIVIDVREIWEYEEVNIGALNFPLNDLPKKLDALNFCLNKEVVVFCKSGNRSNQARKYLLKHGFKNVKSLEGGIENYLKA
jgi:rhodanese-related sulfurtransferase